MHPVTTFSKAYLPDGSFQATRLHQQTGWGVGTCARARAHTRGAIGQSIPANHVRKILANHSSESVLLIHAYKPMFVHSVMSGPAGDGGGQYPATSSCVFGLISFRSRDPVCKALRIDWSDSWNQPQNSRKNGNFVFVILLIKTELFSLKIYSLLALSLH